MSFVPGDQRKPSGTYTFSSLPRTVEDRCKYRDTCERTRCTCVNIIYDQRVVRGNTSAQCVLPSNIRRRGNARTWARVQFRTGTPEAVPGRQHIEVQTDRYLEELSNIIVTTEMDCQTDAFLDRPASPLFIPAKSGKDVETQIEEGELFDFDREVQPALEVLVGKTLEQSLLEVMEEEELACLRAQQKAFRELRNNELAEVQRLEEQERRLTEEKERRIAQQRETIEKEREIAEKIAARAYTQEYLADLHQTLFNSLRNHGQFYDPVEQDIETNFLPWLMTEVNNTLERRNAVRGLLDNIILDVAEKKLESFKEPETVTEHYMM